MGKGLEGKSHEEQMRALCLEKRRLRSDLAEGFSTLPREAEGKVPISVLS